MITPNRKQIIVAIVLFALLLPLPSRANELDLSFDQVDFAQIFQVLGESQGLNVLVDPEVSGQGTISLQGVSFKEALDLISKYSGYAYRLKGNTLWVGAEQKLLALEGQEVRYITIQKVSAQDVLEALALVMPRSDVYVQPQGNLVVLHGSPEVLDRAEELIGRLDNSLQPKGGEQERSLLDIFKDLSADLELNLVADPELEGQRLYIDVRNREPLELIKEIQQLVPLTVEVTENSLVVGGLREQNTERLKVYRLDYVEPAAARTALSMLVDEQNIRLDEERKSLIVRGTDTELAEVDLFLIDFDKPAPQVVLEVWVQEIATDALQNLGVDWIGTPSFAGGDAPVFFELEWEPWDLVWALRMLEEQGDAKLLANPQITTLSGQPANIFVGDRVPVVLDSPDGTRTMEFLESGINLKVTPRISEDDYITILVQPEVSTFIWRADTPYPQIRTREAETTVRVKNGQPFVLGGLLQEQENETIKRIPFLSQLPVLGKLFQWKESKQTQTEMTIFLIPRIVEEAEGVGHKDFFTEAQ